MRRAILTVLLALPVPAGADTFCEDLWIARNTIFHRAGYCFGSALGQGLFGNAGCIGTSPQLASADAEAVDQIRLMENDAGCRVATTSAPTARMRTEAARLSRLRDIPAADHNGWACLGYTGPGLTLRSGASADSPVTGQATAGQFLFSEYLLRDGWKFVVATTGHGRPTVAEGWTRDTTAPGECLEEAG
ncbi:MAG: DUF4453 domain-containing protein [Paracoccaceae bacterium]|nr:MAG: DUF4453 domain-containing protein [Paracoccaceae bacterium]